MPVDLPDFSAFLPEHAARLSDLIRGPEWQAALADESNIARLRESVIAAPDMPDPAGVLVGALKQVNEADVRARIAGGDRDVDALAWRLGEWPDEWTNEPPVLSFVGVYLTLDCNARPKCVYCNQLPVDGCLPMEEWGRLVSELIQGDGQKPYFSYTGGEPLTCGDALYGPEGLIRQAATAGAPSNINTNAFDLTLEVALKIVHAGAARLHVSLDTPDPEVMDELAGGTGRFDLITRGLYNLQVARELLGVNHPVVHINCVLTTRSIFEYPKLVGFLLDRKRVATPGVEGPPRADPHFRDLGIHLIPVGGPQNADIRPTADDYERFFTRTWEAASDVWETYQDARGTEDEARVDYDNYAFFANPYKRVEYRGELRDYCEAVAESTQSTLALGKRCLVAPTQAFFLPDGCQHWCGGHGVSRPEPMGHRSTGSAQGSIASSPSSLRQYPNEFCTGCPVATLFINQGAENALNETVKGWIEEADSPPATPEPPPT